MVNNGIPQSHNANIPDILFYTFDDLYEQEEVITKKSSNREYDVDVLHSEDQDEVIEPIFIVEKKVDEEEEKDDDESEPLDLSDNTFLDHVAEVTGCQFRR